MEKQIRVSVVTPVYNDERHLEQCLESLCRQTLREIEFVCVDDGSTDSSSAILQSYRKRDERFVIVRQPNRGLGAAMNAGIRQARGEYIGIVESDDFADPDMFRTLYDTAVGLGAEVIKSDCWLYYNGESVYSATFEDIDCSGWICPLDYPDAFYLQRNWSGLYSREFLVRNEVRENETPGASFQDVSFNFLVMACVKRFYYLKKAFLHYRADNALSSTHSRGKTFALCDECDYFERFLKERNGDNRLWAILANSRFRLCQREARFRVDEGQVYPFLSRAVASYRADYAKGRYDHSLWKTEDWEEACRILENPETYLAGVKELLDERETKRQAVLNLVRNEADVYIYGAGRASGALREVLSSYGVGIRGFVVSENGTQNHISEKVYNAREVVRDDPLILVPVRHASQPGTKVLHTDKGWRVLCVDWELMRILRCELYCDL